MFLIQSLEKRERKFFQIDKNYRKNIIELKITKRSKLTIYIRLINFKAIRIIARDEIKYLTHKNSLKYKSLLYGLNEMHI